MALPEQTSLLLSLLRNAKIQDQFNDSDWELLIRQCKSSLLMGSVGNRLIYQIPKADFSDRVKAHFQAALTFWERQKVEVDWQVKGLAKIFLRQDQPLVLLKGAAYMISGMGHSVGRSFNDIDCLVAHAELDHVADALNWKGWFTVNLTNYDKFYYRKWMHELPPMRNLKNGTTLDIHHAILPLTAKYHPNTSLLFERLRKTQIDNVYTLCPEDMVIHSATHLFHEGEFDHGLRDLVDIKELLRYFSENESGFWDRLVPRAIELDLIRPLYYGLHYAQQILAAEIPDTVMQDAAAGAPNFVMKKVMDGLFLRALRPDHPSCDLPGTGFARWLLYIRSHYLRMPLYLLIPHLVRKSWKRRFDKSDAETAAV